MRLVQLAVIASSAFAASAGNPASIPPVANRTVRLNAPQPEPEIQLADAKGDHFEDLTGDKLVNDLKENEVEDEDAINLEDVIESALAAHDAEKKEAEKKSGFLQKIMNNAPKSRSECTGMGLFRPMNLILMSQATGDMKGTGTGLSVCLTPVIKNAGRHGAVGLVGYRGSTGSQDKIEVKVPLTTGHLLSFKKSAEAYFTGEHGTGTPAGIVRTMLRAIRENKWSDDRVNILLYPAPDMKLDSFQGSDEVRDCLKGDKNKCGSVMDLGSVMASRNIYLGVMEVNPVAGEDLLHKLVEVAGIQKRAAFMTPGDGKIINSGYCAANGKTETKKLLNELSCLSVGL